MNLSTSRQQHRAYRFFRGRKISAPSTRNRFGLLVKMIVIGIGGGAISPNSGSDPGPQITPCCPDQALGRTDGLSILAKLSSPSLS